MKHRPLAYLALLLTVLGTGCASHHPYPDELPDSSTTANQPAEAPPAPLPAFLWRPELSPEGPCLIEIYPDHGRLLLYRNRILIGVSTISTGKEGHDTPPGKYRILKKTIDHRSNEYGSLVDATTGRVVRRSAEAKDPVPPGAVFKGAPMPYFQRLTYSGVGLHAGDLPGYNASHGCIRLPREFAPLLYSATTIGTPVNIIAGRVVSPQWDSPPTSPSPNP